MKRCLLVLLVIAVGGCSGARPGKGSLSPQGPRSIAIKLHSAPKLNTDRKGQPLALVTRIYKLRQRTAFDQASFDSFLTPHKEREALGPDLLEVQEVLLIPGQRHEITDTLERDANFIGVVALFHAPAAQRWRLVFGAPEAEKTGITIGAHACSLSVGGAGRPAPCH